MSDFIGKLALCKSNVSVGTLNEYVKNTELDAQMEEVQNQITAVKENNKKDHELIAKDLVVLNNRLNDQIDKLEIKLDIATGIAGIGFVLSIAAAICLYQNGLFF